MESERIEGRCDGCGKFPRILNTIESGQRLCRFCLREFRPTGESGEADGTRSSATVKASPSPSKGRRDVRETEPSARHFHSKVVGISRRNTDGTLRQQIARHCEVDEMLRLVHDPQNPVDPNAVELCRQNGEQIGFLKRHLAAEIVGAVAADQIVFAYVSEVTGGTREKPTVGINLLIVIADRGIGDGELDAYIKDIPRS